MISRPTAAESNNLADKEPDRVNEMATIWREWDKECRRTATATK